MDTSRILPMSMTRAAFSSSLWIRLTLIGGGGAALTLGAWYGCVSGPIVGPTDACTQQGDCAPGQACIDGRCSSLCNTASDCPGATQACVNGVCQEVDDPACDADADCTASDPCIDGDVAPTCQGGACVYGWLSPGVPCDDGDPCTLEDACTAEGACVGHANPCDEPPPSECNGTDDVFIVYDAPGLCDQGTGACAYEAIEIPCADCSQSCEAACAEMACDDLEGGCLTHGVCLPGPPAECQYTPAQDGTPCDLSAVGAADGVCLDGACVEAGGAPCPLPWGGSLPDGETVTAYERGCGGGCPSEIRVCSDGVLSGTYEHASCAPSCTGEDCVEATHEWGDHGCSATFSAVAHGQTDTQSNTVEGRTGSATFACDDGAWTLTHGTCAPAACALPWGGSLAHGGSVTAYQYDLRPCGQSCPSQSPGCDYGVLSGTYAYEGCDAPCAGCDEDTLGWGTHGCEAPVPAADHGGAHTATNTRAGRSGSASFTCNDGAWVLGTSSCEGDPCDLPWGGTLDHGASVAAYAASSVACGSVCSSESRTCSYGALSGSNTHESCSVGTCLGCGGATLTWGTHDCNASFSAVNHGQQQTRDNGRAGRTGSATFSCNNGVWEFDGGTCTANGCTAPWGGSVAHGSSVTAYSSSSVACDGTCSSQSRTCSYGSLSGSYTHQSCAPATCGPNQTCVDGACLANNGRPCQDADDCASGHCVEGVCCNQSCTAACFSCTNFNTGVATGTCAVSKRGTDPGNRCQNANGQCYRCDGEGSCGTAPADGQECFINACGGDCQVCQGGLCMGSDELCGPDYTCCFGTFGGCNAYRCEYQPGGIVCPL